MMRKILFLAAFVVVESKSYAVDFDRQSFLAAVKERFKSEPALMELRSPSDSTLRIDAPVPNIASQDWQKNLMNIPSVGQFGPSASFGVALGYLASQELRIPFSGRYPNDAIIWIDNNGVRFNQAYINPKLLQTVFDDKGQCRAVNVSGASDRIGWAISLCRDLKKVLADVQGESGQRTSGDNSTPNGQGVVAPVPAGRKLGGRYAGNGFEGTSADATARLERLNSQKNELLSALNEFGPAPSLPPTTDTSTRNKRLTYARSAAGQTEIEEKANANRAEVEKQLPILRDELKKRRVEYAKQVIQKSRAQLATPAYSSTPSGSPLSHTLGDLKEGSRQLDGMIGGVATDDDAAKVYETAKKLDATCIALAKAVATRERAVKGIESARAEVSRAAQRSGDGTVVAAVKDTNQAVSELTAKLQNNDPKDETQVSALADRVAKAEQNLKSATRQATVLSSSTGKRVYQGCVAWAQRKGIASPVRVFKDDATNNAANQGEQLCRCMATEISGDKEITDEAKLEIAHQFETTDRMTNQQLALVVGAASLKCQKQAMDSIVNQR